VGVRSAGLIAAVALLGAPAVAQVPADQAQAAAERWGELRKAIFPGRTLEQGEGIIALDAPVRALDAALVPFSVTTSASKPIEKLYLIIDNNPGPLAGRFTFGEAGDPSLLKVRMRVNAYTNVHAVAEDASGALYAVEKFVKASGGCSAPAPSHDPSALSLLGEMRFKVLSPVTLGKPAQAQLMVRHPNFNGMQMDQVTRHYTPAHFIKTIDITYGDQSVLQVESDIALSSDPVITFGFIPRQNARMKVVVSDSKGKQFEEEFDVVPNARVSDAH
jgi:sulfur-oxidizing protein SoxY